MFRNWKTNSLITTKMKISSQLKPISKILSMCKNDQNQQVMEIRLYKLIQWLILYLNKLQHNVNQRKTWIKTVYFDVLSLRKWPRIWLWKFEMAFPKLTRVAVFNGIFSWVLNEDNLWILKKVHRNNYEKRMKILSWRFCCSSMPNPILASSIMLFFAAALTISLRPENLTTSE